MSLFKGNGWKKGDNYAICDVCGLRYLSSELSKRWDGLVVCEDDWEPRHPQEFVRAVADIPTAKGYIRVEPNDDFRLAACNSENRIAVAGVGIASCMIAGLEPGDRAGVYDGSWVGTFNEDTL